jgi:HK97 gp10 family phage protein
MARLPTLIGRARLQRKLNALSTDIKAPIRAAIAQGAAQIVAMAKSLVPEDTGALRDSIGWTWGRTVPKGSIVLAATQALGNELTATIYAGNSEAFYARWIEFGTTKMTAQPYFFPAYRSNKKSVKTKIRAAVRKAARSAAKS